MKSESPLRRIVAHHRGAARERGVARLPSNTRRNRRTQAPCAPCRRSGYCQRSTSMSREFVVVDRIAPHLLLLGEDIAVFSDGIQFAALVVAAAVGIEVVALRIPDIRMAEIVGVIGRQVVDHRIAREVVLLAADLHPIHADHRAVVGIVVTAVRFELVFAVGHHAPSANSPTLVLVLKRNL